MPPGIEEAAMDLKADPCDDFYRYACGGWIDRTEIRPDRSAEVRTFVSISDRNNAILRQILEDAAAGKLVEESPYQKQLGDVYATCMNEPALEESLPVLKTEQRAIDQIQNTKSLAVAVGRLHAGGISAAFEFGSEQDARDATKVIGALDQANLTLPDRDYYLQPGERAEALREAYLVYLSRIFVLLEQPPTMARHSAEVVLNLETGLAQASMPRDERRDPEKVYHPLERKALKAESPAFDWDAYFSAVGAPRLQNLNITNPPYLATVSHLIRNLPLSSWRTYLTWRLVVSYAQALPQRFREQFFALQSLFSGAKKERPRWETCLHFIVGYQGLLNEAAARPFVAKTLGPDGRTRASEEVQAVESALEREIHVISWMDDETKARALEKLHKVVNRIGYPERWRSYDDLKTDRSSFLANLKRARAFDVRYDLQKIGKPVDRTEWDVSPTLTDAFSRAQRNDLLFPAGILQPPFFDKEATLAASFGGLGSVAGHELTHCFDDQGRRFDAEGNLRDWWSPGSGKAYLERAECVKALYSKEVAIEDLHVNGALTAGENISDMGGVKLAHDAMQHMLRSNGESAPYRYNAEQQFFIAFAQNWCGKTRPELARLLVRTDPHSPFRLRVNVPLSKLESFQRAFSCPADSKMVRSQTDRCEVW